MYNRMTTVQSQEIITINSRDRQDGTDSAFIYGFKPRNKDFDRLVVLSAQIPKSYYLIDIPYNKFQVRETLVDDRKYYIEFEPGNYSRRSFQNILQQKLNEESAAQGHGFTYSMSYPDAASAPETGKYSWQSTGDSAFIFTDGIFEQCGFEQKSTNVFQEGKLTSANVIKFQVEDTLFLYSDIVGGENDTNILQEFYVASETMFSNISYKCLDVEAQSRRITNTTSTFYRFWLLNEDGREVNLNGLNMVLTIRLYKSYNPLDTVKSVAQSIIGDVSLQDMLRSVWKFIKGE